MIHLVCSWWCLDCPERGDDDMTQAAANKAAEEHTKATHHPTNVNYRPERT